MAPDLPALLMLAPLDRSLAVFARNIILGPAGPADASMSALHVRVANGRMRTY
jgi:hypothetical protein